MPIFQIQVYPSRSNQGHTNFPSLSAIPFPARTVMPFTTTVCNASFLCNPSLDSIRVFFSGYKCVDCFLSQAQTSRVVVLDIKVPHGWTSTQKRALRNVHKLDRTGCAFFEFQRRRHGYLRPSTAYICWTIFRSNGLNLTMAISLKVSSRYLSNLRRCWKYWNCIRANLCRLIRVSRLLTPIRKCLLAFRDFLTLMRLWFDFENSTAKFERKVLHRCQSRTWGPFLKQKTDRGNLAFWKSCMSSLPRLCI